MIPFRNTEERYGKIAMFLHWAIALLIIALVAVGLIMTDLPKDHPQKYVLYGLHKSVGVIVAFLVILRIFWRLTNPTPLLPHHMKGYEKLLAHLIHFGLYVIMIVMPLSGYVDTSAGGHKLSFFGLFDIPTVIAKNHDLGEWGEEIHEKGAIVLYVLFALHLLGALKHRFIDKDTIVPRMLPMDLK